MKKFEKTNNKKIKELTCSEINFLIDKVYNSYKRMEEKLILCNKEDKESYLFEIKLQKRICRKLSYLKNVSLNLKEDMK
jgi:hypothetical protein